MGSVQQEVDIAGDVYINYVRVGRLTGKLEATWEVVNKRQWKVIECVEELRGEMEGHVLVKLQWLNFTSRSHRWARYGGCSMRTRSDAM